MAKRESNCSVAKHDSNRHILLMILICIIPLLLLFAAVKYWGFSANYLGVGVILLCIGMHIWMMGKHKRGHEHG